MTYIQYSLGHRQLIVRTYVLSVLKKRPQEGRGLTLTTT